MEGTAQPDIWKYMGHREATARMDVVEEKFAEDLLGDGARRDKRRVKAILHQQRQEAREISRIALARQENEDDSDGSATGGQSDFVVDVACATPRELCLSKEFARLRNEHPEARIHARSKDYLHVSIGPTKYRNIVLKLIFPPGYPSSPLAVELSSSHVAEDPLAKLKTAVEKESERIAKAGAVHGHILSIIQIAKDMVFGNRLLPCFEDILQLKDLLQGRGGITSMKQDSGVLEVEFRTNPWVMRIRVTVPDEYPAKTPLLELVSSNVPEAIADSAMQAARSTARRLAEPPDEAVSTAGMAAARTGAGTGGKVHRKAQYQTVQSNLSERKASALVEQLDEREELRRKEAKKARESFVPEASIVPALRHALEGFFLPMAGGRCSLCEKTLLPTKPSLLEKVPKAMRPERLTCGHCYHFKCLEEYLATPPFGKGCQKCGEPIHHPRLVTDKKVLEARWSHKKAKEREIEDVIALMG